MQWWLRSGLTVHCFSFELLCSLLPCTHAEFIKKSLPFSFSLRFAPNKYLGACHVPAISPCHPLLNSMKLGVCVCVSIFSASNDLFNCQTQ